MTVRSRYEWGASTPLGPRLVTPVRKVFIHHSVTTPTNNPDADFRTIDRIGRQRFGIFSYSWVVHPSGVGGEGAGLHRGAHTGGHNSTSISICFIGNYEHQAPSKAAQDTAVDMIRFLKAIGVVTRDASIRGHRDVKSTACPGRHLYAIVPDIARRSNAVPAPKQSPMKPPGLAELAEALRAARRLTLRRGSRGEAVKLLQSFLNHKMDGRDLVVDGDFGPSTEAAVKRFQENTRRFFGLPWREMPSDGIVGPVTWFWLTG